MNRDWRTAFGIALLWVAVYVTVVGVLDVTGTNCNEEELMGYGTAIFLAVLCGSGLLLARRGGPR